MPGREKQKKLLKDHIDQVESNIADMDSKMLKAEGDLEAYYQDALLKLKEIRALADNQLERIHEAGGEAWDDLKDEVDEAIERLRSNLDNLMARFSDEEPVDHAEKRKQQSRSNKSGHEGDRPRSTKQD